MLGCLHARAAARVQARPLPNNNNKNNKHANTNDKNNLHSNNRNSNSDKDNDNYNDNDSDDRLLPGQEDRALGRGPVEGRALPAAALVGAKDCIAEIDTSEIIVGFQWHASMECRFCDICCNILPRP